MDISQFIVGHTFFASAGFEWLCTDKGTRTITAIFLDPDKNPVWFQGPPYSVEEVVFDEHEMKRCYLNLNFELGERLAQENKSAHPNFDAEDVFKMLKDTGFKQNYPRKKILTRDRVGSQGEIFHPYSAHLDKATGVWSIQIFEIFSKTYLSMPEDDFVQLPFSSEVALENRKTQFSKDK